MFTLDQISTAHSKVKSGADFPKYIQEIKILGVVQYETFVVDGHVEYYGAQNFSLKAPEKYSPLTVAGTLNETVFKVGLKAHQEGKTDYPCFINMCAEAGIEKWTVNLDLMNCTYFDTTGNIVLEETIPS